MPRLRAGSAHGSDPVVELKPTAEGVGMTLTFDSMHDDEWTQRAVMGWNMELDKADRLVAARTAGQS